jgi:adenosylmethionine-8-amino-7-oxononanoate aminotransferase
LGTDKKLIKQLENDDFKYLWHPFTQMREYVKEKPLIIKEGRGCILKDIYGNEYLDGVSSLWTNVHGHRKHELDIAIKKQLDLIAHSTLLGMSNVPAVQCAKKLVQISPDGLNKVFFSDDGSTAVEIALKMAFQYHRQSSGEDGARTKFMCLANSYHGDTIGAVSVGGIDLFHATYGPLLFETIKVESPYCYRCPFDEVSSSCEFECLRHMEELMRAHAHEIAALVMEPMVQGAGGIIVQPPGYLKKVRALCTRYNIIMIADEVAVGFGKTGKMFGCDHEGVQPDIMTLGKGITGGYLPLSATLVSDRIYNGFLGQEDELKTFFHGHTYTGNQLACAAAIANLKIFDEEKTVAGLGNKIDFFADRLQSFSSLEHVGDVRQCGFMAGIELVSDKDSKQPFSQKDRIGHRVIMEARGQGLIIRPLGDVVVIMPPLAISKQDLDNICRITYASIKAVTS